MRVLQLHNAYGQAGGEDTIVETEARLLESAGHLVRRLRLTNPTNGLAAAGALARAPHNRHAAARVADVCRSWRPDVAHVHNTWFSYTPEVFHRLHDLGIPVVMTLQNYRLLCANAQLFRAGRVCTDCVGTHPWRGVVHRCYRDSIAASTVAAATIGVSRRRGTFDLVGRFLAPSSFVSEIFIGAGFDRSRIVVRPNAVEDPGRRARPPSRSRTILYAGRLSQEKGVATLLDGWRRSGLGSRGFTLELIGEGPLRSSLERSAPAGVRFAGWMPVGRLHQQMLRSRALAFPSEWYENFGRVIIEAMAAGLPVLASDIATPAEIVAPLGPSWLSPPGSAEAWAEGLSGLADDDETDRAGLVARSLYEERYGLERGLESLVAVYREVMSTPP